MNGPAPTTAADLVARSGLDATGADAPGGDVVAATEAEYRYDPERTVGLLAGALTRLHAVTVPDGTVPVLDPGSLVARAERALDEGLLHAEGLDDAYAHMAPERLVAILRSGAPAEERSRPPVLTHGAPTLEHLRCRDGAAVGFVRWDGAAVADPYRDLAVAARSVATGLGPMLVATLFERCGIDRPDPVLVDWYALVDQLERLAGRNRR